MIVKHPSFRMRERGYYLPACQPAAAARRV